jgi:hypothetical protein
VKFTVDTTFDEVVDVTADQPSPLATCLADALWTANLPACRFASERDQLQTTLP